MYRAHIGEHQSIKPLILQLCCQVIEIIIPYKAIPFHIGEKFLSVLLVLYHLVLSYTSAVNNKPLYPVNKLLLSLEGI